MIVDNEFDLPEPEIEVRDTLELCGRVAVVFAQSFLDEVWDEKAAEPEGTSSLKRKAKFIGECLTGVTWARFISMAAGRPIKIPAAKRGF